MNTRAQCGDLSSVPRMDAHDWVSSYGQRTDEILARAARARDDLVAVTATATSRDGAVRLTVGPGGALLALVLGHAADGLGRAELAEAILATAEQARAEAADRAARAVAGLVGDDSEAMRVLRSSMAGSDSGARR